MTWEQLGVLATVAAAVISIVGIGVAIYLNNRRARRHRISEVVDAYVSLCTGRTRVDSGPSAFVTAGAKSLEDDGEVREAVRQIVSRVGETDHPFGGHRDDLPEGLDLKRDVVDRLDPDGDNSREIREICEELS